VSFAEARPSFVVDISEQYEERKRAILSYGSQFTPQADEKNTVHLGLDELEGEMNHLARHYGQMVGVKYGEPFFIKELMKVDDVVKMEVRSV
jgi:LmbE family N-acetylglucosaminyl deacetylase